MFAGIAACPRRKINVFTVLAGRRLGSTEDDDSICS